MTVGPSTAFTAARRRAFFGNDLLQRYVDEQAHRFNHRKTNDGERFADVMSTVVGRRLTWRILTAQDGAGFMGLE